MNKLGFAVEIASGGVGIALDCNRDAWISRVCDVRDYLKFFNGLEGSNNTISFISFDEHGCFLTVLRPQSGRVGDNISGWIYIPNNILVSGEELVRAHDFVKEILAESNLSVVKDQIEAFFSKEYPTKEVYSEYLPSSGDKYAFRLIGHYSLKEILDRDRYQPYYSKYKAVFLLSKNSEVTYRESSCEMDDLSKFAIEKTYILMPPNKSEISKLGGNVRFFFENGAEFVKAVPFKANVVVKLYAVRGNFEPQPFVVNVSDEITYCDLSKFSPEWLMKINRSIFKVVDQDNNEVKNYNLTIGSQRLAIDGYVFLSEKQLHNAQVLIDSTYYEDFYGKCDLTRSPVTISLERKGMEFNSTMKLSNGKKAEIIVRSKYLDPYKSPFVGYKISYNELVEDSTYKWKQRVFGFLFALILFALFVLYSICESRDGGPSEVYKNVVMSSTSSDSMGNINEQKDNSPSLKELIEYLDNNKVWDKSVLIKMGKAELFSDMNNFNLLQLLSTYEDLSESQNFLKVKQAAEECYYYKRNPKIGIHNPTWNKENDSLINIDKYVGWLYNPTEQQTNTDKPSVDNNVNKASSELDRQIKEKRQNRDSQKKTSQQPKQSQNSGQQQKKNQGNKNDIFS